MTATQTTTATTTIHSFFKTHCRLTAVILAGTKGSRLFPLTSSDTPKHLLPVAGIPSILRLLDSLDNFREIVIAINSQDDDQTLKVVEQVATLKQQDQDQQQQEEESNTTTNVWKLESTKNQQTITIIKLDEECFGPADALRQVETKDVIHSQSRIVVFPGDLVFLRKDLDLDKLLRPDEDSACTALLVDVGEVDEHGIPLKESAKVSFFLSFFCFCFPSCCHSYCEIKQSKYHLFTHDILPLL